MIWSGAIAAVWGLAATVTAFLPLRRQFVPGIVLLLAGPAVIGWLAVDYAWPVPVLALLAFASMFRHPLRYLLARLRGQDPALPPEIFR